MTRLGYRFAYRTRAHFLRTTPVKIDINEGQFDYIVQLARGGLWGNTVEDVIDRLICKGIEAEMLKGNVKPVRLDIRRNTYYDYEVVLDRAEYDKLKAGK